MMDNEPQNLPQDTAFDLLSNGRRRLLLRRLQGTDGVELGDLATELSAIENDIHPEELTTQQRKRTYVSLYQTHIPKLEDAGVVTFDPETGVVRPTALVDELAVYFASETSTIAWELLYLAFAFVGLLVFIAASVVQIPVLRPIYVGAGVLLGLIVLSLVHRRHARQLDTHSEIDTGTEK